MQEDTLEAARKMLVSKSTYVTVIKQAMKWNFYAHLSANMLIAVQWKGFTEDHVLVKAKDIE